MWDNGGRGYKETGSQREERKSEGGGGKGCRTYCLPRPWQIGGRQYVLYMATSTMALVVVVLCGTTGAEDIKIREVRERRERVREEGGKGVGKNNRNFRASDEGGDESARKGQCKSKGGHCIGGTIFRGGSDQTI